MIGKWHKRDKKCYLLLNESLFLLFDGVGVSRSTIPDMRSILTTGCLVGYAHK